MPCLMTVAPIVDSRETRLWRGAATRTSAPSRSAAAGLTASTSTVASSAKPNDGQPVPLSNLSAASKSLVRQPAQRNAPARFSPTRGELFCRSVPPERRMKYLATRPDGGPTTTAARASGGAGGLRRCSEREQQNEGRVDGVASGNRCPMPYRVIVAVSPMVRSCEGSGMGGRNTVDQRSTRGMAREEAATHCWGVSVCIHSRSGRTSV